MEYYLEDLNYEADFVGVELKKFEAKIRELLVVKSSSPLVLHLSPQFREPRLVEMWIWSILARLKGIDLTGWDLPITKTVKKSSMETSTVDI